MPYVPEYNHRDAWYTIEIEPELHYRWRECTTCFAILYPWKASVRYSRHENIGKYCVRCDAGHTAFHEWASDAPYFVRYPGNPPPGTLVVCTSEQRTLDAIYRPPPNLPFGTPYRLPPGDPPQQYRDPRRRKSNPRPRDKRPPHNMPGGGDSVGCQFAGCQRHGNKKCERKMCITHCVAHGPGCPLPAHRSKAAKSVTITSIQVPEPVDNGRDDGSGESDESDESDDEDDDQPSFRDVPAQSTFRNEQATVYHSPQTTLNAESLSRTEPANPQSDEPLLRAAPDPHSKGGTKATSSSHRDLAR